MNKKCFIGEKLMPSAVILPVFFKDGEYYILFIKRAQTVKDHKGQISFPGGRRELEDETMLDTALRECEEEIGLPRDKVEIIGALDDCVTLITRYLIATFVGLIPYPYDFKLDRNEIESIIEIPISALYRVKTGPEKTETGSPEFRYNGEVIWGATGIILSQLLDIWSEINMSTGYHISH